MSKKKTSKATQKAAKVVKDKSDKKATIDVCLDNEPASQSICLSFGLPMVGLGFIRRAKVNKSQKMAEREKAVKEARQQLKDSLHALVMSAPSLSEASEIIEKEILQARRTMLEEWYMDHPDDLLTDSQDDDLDIDSEDEVVNKAGDFVGEMDDEEVESKLCGYI